MTGQHNLPRCTQIREALSDKALRSVLLGGEVSYDGVSP